MTGKMKGSQWVLSISKYMYNILNDIGNIIRYATTALAAIGGHLRRPTPEIVSCFFHTI